MKQTLKLHGRTHGRYGSDPIPGIGNIHRIVYGSVLNDGSTVDAGSGDWTLASWDGFNTYTFTVAPAFGTAILNVVATPGFNGDSNDPYLAINDPGSADPDTFVVLTFNFIGDVA